MPVRDISLHGIYCDCLHEFHFLYRKFIDFVESQTSNGGDNIDTSHLFILVWDAFSMICQGTIAGLIILGATTWLQCKKEKELTCKNALLVWLELHGHLAKINDILEHKKFPESALPLSFSTSIWNEAQIYLAAFPIDDLRAIVVYYQELPTFDHLVKAYAGRELTPIMVTSLLQAQTMCVMTQHLLSSYWDSKNVEKHRQSFLHMRQQSHNF